MTHSTRNSIDHDEKGRAPPDAPVSAQAAPPLRAALYLRVLTTRQAEHDVSMPDQKR